MLKHMLRLVFRMGTLPHRLPLHILRSSRYDDKVFFFQIDLLKVQSWFSGSQDKDNPIISRDVRANGGGIYGAGKRLMIDGSGTGGGATIKKETETVSSGSGSGGIHAGLIFRPTKRLRVYPLAGIEGYGGGESMIETDEGSSESSKQNKMMIGAESVSGIGVEYRIGWRYGATVGVRVGRATNVIGGDQRLFVRPIIGIGRFGKKQTKEQPVPETPTETE